MNKIKIFIDKNSKTFLLITFFVLMGYWGSWRAFFQQDEWNGLGKFYALSHLSFGQKIIAIYQPMFKSGLAHFLPFLPITNFIRYSLFGLNFENYIFLALMLHTISAFLVFYFLKTLTKSNFIAVVSSIFFAVLPNASQSVSWVGTSVPTQLSFIFSVLAVIVWLKFLDTNKKMFLLFSFAFLILGIGFKETSLFLFIFLPFLYVLKTKKLDVKVLIPIFLLVILYGVLRISLFSSSTSTNFLESMILILKTAFVNYFQIVLRGVAQVFIPQEIIYSIFLNILKLFQLLSGKMMFDMSFVETWLIKPLMYVLGFITLMALYFKKKYVYLALLLCSFIPIAFITTGELRSVFLSPRSLYIPEIVAAAIIGEVSYYFYKSKKYLGIIFIIIIFLTNFIVLKNQNSILIKTGEERKQILQVIKEDNVILTNTPVFYFESDSPYYGLPEDIKILPFQSGLGQTLLVWYQEKEDFPSPFFQNDFLWEIKSQGYQSYQGRGFGFFRDKELLIQELRNNNIAIESVIGYKWHGGENKLENITLELRNELRKI